MRAAQPRVHLVARPQLDLEALAKYLTEVGGQSWLARFDRGELDGGEDGAVDAELPAPAADAQDLVEAAGRICYRSWEPGLNPNVSRIRTDQTAYLRNVLASAHGSVLEHASFSFVLHDVSRVLTHELVRHRAGVAVSQESLRYVRLESLPFWFPDWAQVDPELMERASAVLAQLEEFQGWMAGHFELDTPGTDFTEKKHKTSFMRRFAPEGLATGLIWTANVRTLRHVIEMRTAPGAEEEIRLVFGEVARLMAVEAPALFGDFEETDGTFVPRWRKV
jgi:thymidylate synthase (FAD)